MLLCMEKKAILNLRLKPEVRDEFAIAADLRGASMSGLLHQFIVRTIREEKQISPQAFPKNERPVHGKQGRAPVVAHIGSPRAPKHEAEMTKDDVQRMIESEEVDFLKPQRGKVKAKR